MRKERNLAVRTNEGDVALYQDSNYPSAAVIELFEKYHHGAAGEILEMVKTDQKESFIIENRYSLLEFWTRLLGMVFAFVLTLAMIGVGTLLITKGNAVSGCVTLLTGIVSVIAIIARGGRSSPRN